MAWGPWKDAGAGESVSRKTTRNESGTREESLRSNEGSRKDHQHTYINRDPSGGLNSAGATPPKETGGAKK